MAYRSLLVLLDQSPRCETRVRAAIKLARELDCHLVGVAPTGQIDLPTSPRGAAALAELSLLAWDQLRGQAQKATERFAASCRALGQSSFEAVVDESEPTASLVRRAHCSDLIVLTQADPGDAEDAATQAVVEDVILQSARPTIVYPYAGRFDTVGSHVTVAWDDSRESSRAVADALPLLQRARRVDVVAWQERGVARHAFGPERLAALERWLLWHGVSAKTHVEPAALPVADALLSRIADDGTDLIVMGAYGHARWRERLLGGATRGLLASMTVPVLMSH